MTHAATCTSRLSVFAAMLILAGSSTSLAADRPVTFAKDVAPIFQQKCQQCHQPNSIAPMSLITYQDARPWARAIRDRVSSRQMPPWHIDPAVGVQHFKNDMSLSQQQIDTIVSWVDQGVQPGNPADMPPPKPLLSGNEWRATEDGYGAPDLVITSHAYTIAPQHQDVWYRPMSDIPLTEPRWVRLVEMRPSTVQGRRIVHHAIAYLQLNNDPDAVNTGTATGRSTLPDLVNARPQLMEWAIGKSYDIYRPGTGKLLVPGEKISWDEHIHAVGEEITSGVQLGIWFYPKGQEPKKRTYLIGFTAIDPGKGLDIPPNSLTMSDGFTVLKENTLITNFQPHFHLRGRAMQVEAILPDGRRQKIAYVGHFNFNWMTNYIFADDAAPAFPKGTVIHVTAWYDNTRANKNNPDPDQWVGYGDRTVDEMGHAWMNVVYLTDEEFKAWQAQHASREVATTG